MNKRFLSLALTLAMLAGMVLTFAPAALASVNHGYITDNGGKSFIDAADVTLLRRYIATSPGQRATFAANNNMNVANADVNGDNAINADDVTLLRRYIAALDPSTVKLGKQFPVPPPPPTYTSSNKLIAITYDDGPDAVITPQVLNHWKNQPNAVATFFINGIKINDSTAPILRRAIEEGHAVENHGWDHRTFGGLGSGGYGGPQITTQAEAIQNINQNSQAIYDVVGIYPWAFRPPFFEAHGHMQGVDTHPQILKRPGQSKLHFVRGAWLDTNDWQSGTAQSFADKVLGWAAASGNRPWHAPPNPSQVWPQPPWYEGADGGMILFHDIYQWTADAVPLFLPTLYSRGYVCVTVEQLFGAGRGNSSTPVFTQFAETNGFDWAY